MTLLLKACSSVIKPSEHVWKWLISPSLLTVIDCFWKTLNLLESGAPALNFCGSMMLPLQTCDTVYLRALPQPWLFHHHCSSTRGSRAVFMFEQCDWRNKLKVFNNDLAVWALLFNEKLFLFMKQQRLHLFFPSLNIYIFVVIKSDLLPFNSSLSLLLWD